MTKLHWLVVALVMLLAAGLLAAPASAAVRLGTVSLWRGVWRLFRPPVRLGMGEGWDPPPLYAGWWGYPSAYPFSDPFYGPSLYWAPQPNLGEVKLQASAKDAEVYLDNAYAGTRREAEVVLPATRGV